MQTKSHKLVIYSFYKFVDLTNTQGIKKTLDYFLEKKKIKGTILISDEGINGTLSGSKKDLDNSIKIIKSSLKLEEIDVKINYNDFFPFNKLKVRLKKEIVSLGQGQIDVNNFHGDFVEPKDWNKIISDKDTRIIDVRNDFEIDIGYFERSERPGTNSFREFAKSIENLDLKKNKKIAMYCTGGIRCEKASAFLKMRGFNDVVQLKGGIIKYLEYVRDSKETSYWRGECFVFDDRVSVDNNLEKGNYLQCYGCRRPITKKDTKSIFYLKGVSCHHCHDERTHEQKKRSQTRQNQIETSEKNNENHPFKRSIIL